MEFLGETKPKQNNEFTSKTYFPLQNILNIILTRLVNNVLGMQIVKSILLQSSFILKFILNQYSHANRYMSFYHQYFCEVVFCFEERSNIFFIETIHCVIYEIHIYLLIAFNNYSTCFT